MKEGVTVVSELRSMVVPMRSEPPDSRFFKQPSVEETGHGHQLVLEGYGCRWFRASEKWVRDGCDKVIEKYNSGKTINFNDFYIEWNIDTSTFGAQVGWPASFDWRKDIEFTYTMCGPGSELYNKFGEKVLLVEPVWDSLPYVDYMEVME
jgi:hypothetical protein